MSGLPELQVARVGADSRTLVDGLLQLYQHDLAEWFQFDVEETGRYGAVHFDADQPVFLLTADGNPAGVALVSTVTEYLQGRADFDMEEFFLMRAFRHRGVGEAFAARV